MKNPKKLISLALSAIMSFATLGLTVGCHGNGASSVNIPESAATSYKLAALGEDTFPIVTYVGPTSEYFSSYEGAVVENLIREDVFKELSETGINVICGHGETEEEMIDILNFSAKYGMTFLPRCNLYDYARWDDDQKKILTYEDYSEEEKQRVDDAFRAYLRKWKAYDGFGGVTAGDETGILVTPAYKRMKEVFEEECPGMLFYMNMFGPMADNSTSCDFAPFDSAALSAGLKHDVQNSWKNVMDKYAHYVDLDVMSFDNYLFYSTNMAGFLYSHIEQFRDSMGDTVKPMWYYVMSGREQNVSRDQTKYESFYQMNAPLTVGVSGIALYPGFAPKDVSNVDFNALYDRKTGQPTYYMSWYKEIFSQIHASESVLMNAAYQGTIATDGSGVSEVVTSKALDDFYRLKEVKSTYSQIVVGCYTWKGHEVLWVFNNATAENKKAQPNLIFNETVDCVVVKEGQQKSYQDKNNLRVFLNPGEAAMVVLGTDTIDIA